MSRIGGREVLSVRMAGWLAAVLLAGVVLGKTAAAEPAQGGKSLSALEKDLQQTMLTKNDAVAAQTIDALVATGEVKAFEAIIQHALAGMNYRIERYAGARLAAAEDPAVKKLILESARKSPNYRTRIILLAVVARMADDPEALETLHKALEDPMRPVVFTALSWIRKLESKESVDPLIKALAVRQRVKRMDRVYYDILRTLEALTGAELEDAVDWKNFWEAQKKGLSAPARSGESRTVAFRRDSFFSVTVDSDRVFFVIDVSGSMSVRDPPVEAPEEGSGKTVVVGRPRPSQVDPASLPLSRERMTRVKEELIRVVQGLRPQVSFGILSFNHQTRPLWPDGGLKNATSTNKTAAVNWVRSLRPSGATRTDLAIRDALTIPEVDTIFLLTDGAPKNEENARLPIEPILALARQLNRFVKARIHTISFQQIRDTRMRAFVTQLAQQNDGEPTWLP